MGFPSYAHPIISDTLDPLSPKEVLNWLKYPQTEYCNLFLVSIKISSPNFKLWLTVKGLMVVLNFALDPAESTLIFVDVAEYPIPVFITLTSIIFPLEITGLNSAPDPAPVKSFIFKSGEE